MRTRIIIYLAIVTVLLTLVSGFVYMSKDHTAPKINIAAGEITYTEGQDDSILLQGVTARDDIDGDITSEIRIYDVAVLENGRQALVTYAVYDKSNNLGKATRMVGYETVKQESEKVEATTEEASTEATTEEVVSEQNTEAPVLKLNTHEVHIKAGDDFYPMDYVENAVDDKDTKEYLYDNMFLDSKFDETKTGTYELIYFCVDSDGNRSNSVKLKLIVE